MKTKLNKDRVAIVVALITGLSALTGILLYFERKRHSKIQSDILELDKNIKEIQLSHLKNGKKIVSE